MSKERLQAQAQGYAQEDHLLDLRGADEASRVRDPSSEAVT